MGRTALIISSLEHDLLIEMEGLAPALIKVVKVTIPNNLTLVILDLS